MASSSSASASPMSMETKQRPWWLSLIGGILAVGIGGVLLFGTLGTKVDTWVFLIWCLGIYWLISGIFDIVSLFVDRTAWAWKLFMGIVSIIAGGYIAMHPVASAAVLPQIFVLVLGIWGLIQGIIMLLLAFRGGGWGAGILGALAILFGLILIANYGVPGMGITFVWVAALFAFIGGFVMIFRSFQERRA